jgi:hypothetical protein
LKTPIRRHEVRDNAGHLVAVLELIEPANIPIGTLEPGMVELAADVGGRSIRVRVYPPAALRLKQAAA